MKLTYAELAKEIDYMSDEQKQADVTIYISGMDEYYPVKNLSFTTPEVDVLDANHPVLNLSDEE